MGTDSSTSTYSTGDDTSGRCLRLGPISESNPMRGVIDVAMVGLIGGGPRLAIRAARVFLEDSYASRSSARKPLGITCDGSE